MGVKPCRRWRRDAMNRGVLTLNSHATSACRALAAKLPPGVEFREGSRGDLQSDLGRLTPRRQKIGGRKLNGLCQVELHRFGPQGTIQGLQGTFIAPESPHGLALHSVLQASQLG